MRIVVPVKLIPDLVEELNIDAEGKDFDRTWMRLVINELDLHAVEQAILLKETLSAEVIVIAPDVEGVEDVLFSAAAAGADRLIRIAGLGEGFNNHDLAHACQPILADLKPDLVLTGVQAHDDLDGQFGPILAESLGYPYVGYIAGMNKENGSMLMRKEFPGGLVANFRVQLPAVVGIQAASSPPRYIAFSRVRQARNTAAIEDVQAAEFDLGGAPEIDHMFQPEVGEKAQMFTGSLEEISARMIEIFKDNSLI